MFNTINEENKVNINNIEIEYNILGNILINKNALDEIGEMITPDDFYNDYHKIIYEVILSTYRTKNIVDPIIVSENIKKNEFMSNKMKNIDILEYIQGLTEYGITVANIMPYIEKLKEYSMRRQLINVADIVKEKASRGYDDVDTLKDFAEAAIFKLNDNKNKDIVTLKELSANKFNSLMSDDKEVNGLSSGYTDFDYITNGFHPSDLIILAARPSMGKSALALNFALNVARIGHKVLFFSLEMGADQLYDRILSMYSNVNFNKIKNFNLNNEEKTKINYSISQLYENNNLIISDTSKINVYEIRNTARKIKRDIGLDFIVIDYLQLIDSTSNNNRNREQAIAEISRSLKMLAKELKIPILALSQLSRSVESRSTDKRPMLSDLRESGAIEQDADLVMFIYRAAYYKNKNIQDKESHLDQISEVILGKHRNGSTGTIYLAFKGEIQKFLSCTKEQKEEYKKEQENKN